VEIWHSTRGGTTQLPEQAVLSEVTRFESWRAHHPHNFPTFIALRLGDRNSLVYAIAGCVDDAFRGTRTKPGRNYWLERP